MLQGGRDLNIVPDFCRAGLDLRLHPAVSAREVLARLRVLARQHAPRTRLRIHRTGPRFVTPRDLAWAKALRGAGSGWAAADWFCDANVFAAGGIPAVAFGPGDIAQAHTRDEFIREADLRDGAEAFLRFLTAGATGAERV